MHRIITTLLLIECHCYVLPSFLYNILYLSQQNISMASLRQITDKFMEFYNERLQESRNSQKQLYDDDFLFKFYSFINQLISLNIQPCIQGKPNLQYDSKFKDIFNVLTSLQFSAQYLKNVATMIFKEKKNIEIRQKLRKIVLQIQLNTLKQARTDPKNAQILEQNILKCFQDGYQNLHYGKDKAFNHLLCLEFKIQTWMLLKEQTPNQLMLSSIFRSIRSTCMNDKRQQSIDILKKSIEQINEVLWKHFAVRSIIYEQMNAFLVNKQKTQGQPQVNTGKLIKSKGLVNKKISLKIEQLIKLLLYSIQNHNLQEINENQQNLQQYIYQIKEKEYVNDEKLVQEIVFAQYFSSFEKKYGAQILLSLKTLQQLLEFIKTKETYALQDKPLRPKIDGNFTNIYQVQTQFRLLLQKLSLSRDDSFKITEKLTQIESYIQYLPKQIQPKYDEQFKKHKKQWSNNIQDKLLNQKGSKKNIVSLFFLFGTDRNDYFQFQLKLGDKFQQLNENNHLQQWLQFLELLTLINHENESFYSDIEGQSKLCECLNRIMHLFKQSVQFISQCLQFTSALKKRYDQLKKNICNIVNIFIRILSFSSKAISKDYFNSMLNQITQAFKKYPVKYSAFKKKIQTKLAYIRLEELNKSSIKSIMNDLQNAKKAFDIVSVVDSELTKISVQLLTFPQQIEKNYRKEFKEIVFLKEPLKCVNLELTQASKDFAQLKMLINDGIFNKGDQFLPNLQILKRVEKIRDPFLSNFLKKHLNEYESDLQEKLSKQLSEALLRFNQKLEEPYLSVKSLDIHNQLRSLLQSKLCILKSEEQLNILRIILENENKSLKEENQTLRNERAASNQYPAHARPLLDQKEDFCQPLIKQGQRAQNECEYENQQRSIPDSFLDNQSQMDGLDTHSSPNDYFFELPQKDNISESDKVTKTYQKVDLKIKFSAYGACPRQDEPNNIQTLFFQHLSKVNLQLFKQGLHFQCVNRLCSIKRIKNRLITTEPKGCREISIYEGNLSLLQKQVLKRINSLNKPERFIQCIARAIGELQTKGFFHRDIKFRNIIAIFVGARLIFKLIDYDKAFLVGEFEEIKSIFQAWLDKGCFQIQIFSFIFGSRFSQVLERLNKIKMNPECQDKMKYIMKQLRLEMMRSHLQQFVSLIDQLLATNKDKIEGDRLNVILSALAKLKDNTEKKIKRFTEDDYLFDMDTYNASSYEQFVRKVTCYQAQ